MYLMLKITCSCGRTYEVDNMHLEKVNCKCPNRQSHPDSRATKAIAGLLEYSADLVFASGENTSNISSLRFVTDPE